MFWFHKSSMATVSLSTTLRQGECSCCHQMQATWLGNDLVINRASTYRQRHYALRYGAST